MFLNYSCSNSSKKEVLDSSAKMVEIKPSEDTLKLSEVFKNCDVVKLENKLFAYVLDAKILDSAIVVMGKSDNSDIHVFTKEGKYIRSLLKYGKGPGEILNIQSMCYNEYHKTIDVLCNYGMCIYQCPIDGSHINKIEIPKDRIYVAKAMAPLNANIYLLYKDMSYLKQEEYKLYVYNYKEDTIVSKILPMDKKLAEKMSVIGQINNLYKNNGKIYFYESFMDGIYEYDGRSLNKVVAFNKNLYTYPISRISNFKDENEFVHNCMNSSYIWAHRNFIQSNNKLFSSFTYLKKLYLNCIDLKTHKSKTYLYVNDDILTNSTFPSNMFYVIDSSGGRLICNIFGNEKLESGDSYLLLMDVK